MLSKSLTHYTSLVYGPDHGLHRVGRLYPKRGGARVIYFHASSQNQLRLLLIYRKGVKDDLSATEKKVLRKLNANW